MFVLFYKCDPYGYCEFRQYRNKEDFSDLWYDIIKFEKLDPISYETDQFFHDIVIDLLNTKQYKDDHIIVEYRS